MLLDGNYDDRSFDNDYLIGVDLPVPSKDIEVLAKNMSSCDRYCLFGNKPEIQVVIPLPLPKCALMAIGSEGLSFFGL